MSPLLLLITDDRRPSRDELLDELLADHALACELRASLDTTPGWRRWRHRRIDHALREVCWRADLIRDQLGATASGEGMYELLERTAARTRSAER